MLLKKILNWICLGRIVQRYHDLSMLGIIGERVQPGFVGHGYVCDPDVCSIVDAWKDFWSLKSKPSRSVKRYDGKYSQWGRNDKSFHDENDEGHFHVRKIECGSVDEGWKAPFQAELVIERA